MNKYPSNAHEGSSHAQRVTHIATRLERNIGAGQAVRESFSAERDQDLRVSELDCAGAHATKRAKQIPGQRSSLVSKK